MAIRILGALLIAAALPIGLWLTYVQWWVHPEWTRQEMFWSYPWHTGAVVVLFAVGVTLIEQRFRRRGK